jgi:hypothetical protein
MDTNTFSYKGSTYEGIGLKYLHSQVLRLLKVASVHGGRAFGGYVRDVITKVKCNDFSKTKVKDLDIWFKTEEERNEFTSNMDGNVLFDTGYSGYIGQQSSDGLKVIKYILKDDFGDNLILVDTVVCPVFPVWDLSVNFLLYDYNKNTLNCMGNNGLTNTLSNIRNRKAVLTYDAKKIVDNRENGDVYIQNHKLNVCHFAFTHRLEKFIENGWTIETSDGRTVTKRSNGELIC